jgi:uncharacterized protein (TIGR01777 family)
MNMKILMTGATGLIGKELGKELVKAGHEIVAISRSSAKAKLDLPYPAKIFEWTDEEAPFPTEAFAGVEAVINLMGENLSEHRWSSSFKQKLINSRVLSTQKLIAAAFQKKSTTAGVPTSEIKVWIQGSAIGYYGESTSAFAFDESSPKGSGFLADLCEEWEACLSALPANLRKVVVRTGVVFSHQGGAFQKLIGPIQNGLGGAIGSGEQLMSTIHLQDEVRFIQFALERAEIKGIFNLVAEKPISQKRITQKLCAGFHVSEGPSVPAFAIKLALGEMSSLVLNSQAVVSTRLKEVGFELQYPQVDDLLNEILHWYQHPFQADASISIHYGEQFVAKPIEEVFAFFADSQNLEKLTPEWLNFKIRKISPPALQKGTKIRYQLRVHGVPMGWLTDIAEWKGPYTLWYHEHRFEPLGSGTLMRDWVRYQLPLGKLGKITAGSKVRTDVNAIFRYRRETISQLF